MLLRFIKNIFPSLKRSETAESSAEMQQAAQLMAEGDFRKAVKHFRRVLELDPGNIGALNDLGACLADMGDAAQAAECFDLACALDDTFVPGLVNQAKLRIERGKTDGAMAILRQAKILAPQMCHVDAVYASYCMGIGDVDTARHYQKRAWLADFDKMRYANCFLFYSAYGEKDERALAAEHLFWAETARASSVHARPAENADGDPASGARRLRIGYWSPDLRNHSVRYFFRPLLENHAREDFEVYVYHDGPATDNQTELIREASEHFIHTFELSDQALADLFAQHRLDILVELAGHSSHNRLVMLQHRHATLQLTALGYPPTTGLKSVDGKVMDRTAIGNEPAAFYSERAISLPSSFWCFEPMEDTAEVARPPAIDKGYVTFGCVGNISKITDDMVQVWADILRKVPSSRLLLRSINFRDSNVEQVFSRRLKKIGMDMDRVDLRKPEGGSEFFRSYADIDIVLDTFPFNGGTTSCFASYMGVPIITLAGESLISRMGASILTNLGMTELIAGNREQYIRLAVDLAQDAEQLKTYRSVARPRFTASSLGDGKKYTQEFEEACRELLLGGLEKCPSPNVNAIAVQEVLRRGYAVLMTGAADAAKRIAEYGLRNYPMEPSLRLLSAHIQAATDRSEAAIKLKEDLSQFTGRNRIEAIITLARWYIAEGLGDEARILLDAVDWSEIEDEFDRQQLALLSLGCKKNSTLPHQRTTSYSAASDEKNICILVPCDDEGLYQAKIAELKAICAPPGGCSFVFRRCEEKKRYQAYSKALQEPWQFIVILQKNASVVRADFFVRLVEALTMHDIVGIAGGIEWRRMNWRLQELQTKAAGLLIASSEIEGGVEVQWGGAGRDEVVGGLAVLDGTCMALKPLGASAATFDEAFVEADYLLEEDWSAALAARGFRLAAHRNLGVLVDVNIALNPRERGAGLAHLAEKRAFDPFVIETDYPAGASVPFASVNAALGALDQFVQ